MSYATPEEFAAYAAAIDLDDLPDDVQGLLDRASQDLDQHLRLPVPVLAPGDPVPATRLDPALLDPWTANSLMRATVAQACYVLIVSEQDVLEGKPHITVAGQVQFSREAPDLVCAAALHCLANLPMLWAGASGSAAAPPEPLPPIAA